MTAPYIWPDPNGTQDISPTVLVGCGFDKGDTLEVDIINGVLEDDDNRLRLDNN